MREQIEAFPGLVAKKGTRTTPSSPTATTFGAFADFLSNGAGVAAWVQVGNGQLDHYVESLVQTIITPLCDRGCTSQLPSRSFASW